MRKTKEFSMIHAFNKINRESDGNIKISMYLCPKLVLKTKFNCKESFYDTEVFCPSLPNSRLFNGNYGAVYD